MEKNNKKSRLLFSLDFTTSKLLSYIVVLVSSLVGLKLVSPEVVIVGLIIGAALSGVKNITEYLIQLKTGIFSKNKGDDDENKKEKEIL
jgi:hypothetical protein